MEIKPKSVYDFTIKTESIEFNLTNVPGTSEQDAATKLRAAFVEAIKQLDESQGT